MIFWIPRNLWIHTNVWIQIWSIDHQGLKNIWQYHSRNGSCLLTVYHRLHVKMQAHWQLKVNFPKIDWMWIYPPQQKTPVKLSWSPKIMACTPKDIAWLCMNFLWGCTYVSIVKLFFKNAGVFSMKPKVLGKVTWDASGKWGRIKGDSRWVCS